ncbi:MAG: hypothetical protein WDZ88_02480 [Candidatus Paceibacterota bacterium]
MNETQQNNKIVVVTVVSLLVGFGFGWITFGGSSADIITENTNATSTNEVANNTTTSGSNTGTSVNTEKPVSKVPSSQIAIKVSNQPAGETTTVDNVVVREVSWVAVQEDRNGLPGNILGVQKVQAGTHDNITVKLLRGTEPNSKNYITIFTDDGDGTFDHKKDLLLVDTEGDVIMSSFTTTNVAVVDESDQESDVMMEETTEIETSTTTESAMSTEM